MSNLKKEPLIPYLKNMSDHLTASKPWNQNQASVGKAGEAAQDLSVEAGVEAEHQGENLEQNLL
jgi:hypothetical protein